MSTRAMEGSSHGTAIPVYVISFGPEAASRLSLELTGLFDVHWVSAIDGRETDTRTCPSLDAERAKHRHGRALSEAEVGCLLSHRKVYGAMQTNAACVALVCEDDAVLLASPETVRALADSMRTDEPAIIVLASRSQSLVERSNAPVGVNGGHLFDFRYVPLQAVAYLVNQRAAELALCRPADGPADWPGWASAVHFQGFYPWPFRESGRPSTIGATPRETLTSRVLSVFWLRYFMSPRRYSSLSEFLYREWMPRMESSAWRRGSRSRAFANDGPWLPSLVLEPFAASLCRVIRRRAAASVRSTASPSW
jgi:hypothetical protein